MWQCRRGPCVSNSSSSVLHTYVHHCTGNNVIYEFRLPPPPESDQAQLRDHSRWRVSRCKSCSRCRSGRASTCQCYAASEPSRKAYMYTYLGGGIEAHLKTQGWHHGSTCDVRHGRYKFQRYLGTFSSDARIQRTTNECSSTSYVPPPITAPGRPRQRSEGSAPAEKPRASKRASKRNNASKPRPSREEAGRLLEARRPDGPQTLEPTTTVPQPHPPHARRAESQRRLTG